MDAVLDTREIRATSVNSASKFGIRVPDWLPLLDSDLQLRDPKVVVDRILVLNCVAAVAAGFD